MIPAARCAALLAAGLSLASCVSMAQRQNEERKAEEKARAEKDALEEVNPKGKAAFYRRVLQLTDAWVQSNTGGAGSSPEESEALGTAIAREVWGRFDEAIEDLKSSDNPRWREIAARGLGFVQNPRVRPALEGALDDKDGSVLASALVSLARGGSPDTDDAKVGRLLTYPDRIVAGNAALCLSRLLQSRRQQGLAALPADRIARVAVDLQVLLFDPTDPILRGNAAQALGELGSPEAEDALLNRVRDENIFVRIKVARALGMTGTPKGYDLLLDSLGREEAKNVQTVTALAIGAIAEKQGLKPPYADLHADAAAWRKWLKK